jgi:Flp pilus assembly protein TadD
MCLLLSACTVSQLATRLTRPERPAADGLSDQAQEKLYLGVIEGLIRQGRYQAALAFLDEYKVASARAEILRGNALLGAGYPHEAIPVYRRAVDSDYAAAAYNGMGRSEAARGGWADAVEDFRRASAIEPANAEYLNNLGYARLHLGSAECGPLAESDLSRAYELDPGSQTIRNNLILAAGMSDDPARRSALLETIADTDKRGAVARFADEWSAKRRMGMKRRGQ